MKIFNLSFEKSVGAVVFREKGNGEREFLLVYSDHWDFPKGHMEKSETEEGTLRREVKEETGIENVEIFPEFRNRISYFYRAKDSERFEREKNGRGINIFKSVIYFLAKTTKPDVVISDEHTKFKWLGYADAHNKITWENSKKILQKAHNFLQK